MKKIYFLFMALFCCLSGYSANCVSAVKVGANYTTQQVTFKLTWTGCNGTTHMNKVWCFVDFQPVDAAGNGGAWQRATISGGATVSNGTYTAGTSNGFWVAGFNGQSATVTVKLGNVSERFDWCVFATDYPPNVVLTGNTYTLKGSAPFILIAADGITKQVVAGNKLPVVDLTIKPVVISDATGCTGTVCPYTGDDLFIDGTHFCQQRTTGAKNWEAWIKDSRITASEAVSSDQGKKYYRIVQLPDGNWWMAQNLDYRKDLVYEGSPGNYGIDRYYCGYGGLSDCNSYGALYNWRTAMLVDGKWSDDTKSSTAWVEPVSFCAGAATATNCNKNMAKGATTKISGVSNGGRGICPDGWHVPTFLEYGTMLNSVNSTVTSAYTNTPVGNTPSGDVGKNLAGAGEWPTSYAVDKFGFTAESGYVRTYGTNPPYFGGHGVYGFNCCTWFGISSTAYTAAGYFILINIYSNSGNSASFGYNNTWTHYDSRGPMAVSVRCVKDS